MPQYLLLDGAQLETKSGLAQIISNHRCCHVYERLGATAAAVGPIVVEPDADLLDAARTWEQTAPRSHAVGHLEVSTSLAQLAQHFWSVRHVHLAEHRQHFLRHADTRVLENLMQVLTPAQIAYVFGPISRWRVGNRKGEPLVFERPDVAQAQAPLRLSSAQGRELLRLSRPDQLLADVLEDEPTLAGNGSAVQRHAWMQQALQLLERLRLGSFPLQRAVGHAVLRTTGAALDDEAFRDVVRAAAEQSDMEPVYSWTPTSDVR